MQSRPRQLIVLTDLLVLSLWKSFFSFFAQLKKIKTVITKNSLSRSYKLTGELLFLPPGIELLTETRVVTYSTLVLEKSLTKHEEDVKLNYTD